ncbi:MAG: HIT family protein [Armatimonadetes bacterium]|nr:HIT family protein [Armatimonadota bacterium]
MDDCVFCQVVRGELDSAIVWQDDATLAFLDRRPLFLGHTLLIPRTHVPTLMDLPQDLVAPLFEQARRLARAVQEAMGADGIFVGINNHVSQSVPHLHLHIVPRTKGDGLKGFFWPRRKYASEDEMAEVAARIRQALAHPREP